MKIKISNDEIRQLLEQKSPFFPKYVSSFLNFVNQFAQGTRPRMVGQMTELMPEFGGKTIDEWQQWYINKKPEAIKAAAEKIWDTLLSIKTNIELIDRDMVEKWVEDFIFVKTFIGLRSQEPILKKGAELLNTDYRFSTPSEESKGIDAFIGNKPVSIKPVTYKVKMALPESIKVNIIFYEKIKDGYMVDYQDLIP